ncbi:hypothetical protein ACHAWF_016199 [Thalassiosira exigua]
MINTPSTETELLPLILGVLLVASSLAFTAVALTLLLLDKKRCWDDSDEGSDEDSDQSVHQNSWVHGRPSSEDSELDTSDKKFHEFISFISSSSPSGEEKALMSWSNLSCVFPSKKSKGQDITTLSRVSGKINYNELVAIMGPSGGGKSTLMDILSGRKSVGKLGGEISLLGESMLSGSPTCKELLKDVVAYVPQNEQFFPNQTPEEAVAFAANLKLGRDERGDNVRQQRIDQTLDLVGISKEARRRPIGGELAGGIVIRGLSGGERKRLALACAVAMKPSLLFLDEITSGLDSENAILVIEIIKKMCVNMNVAAVIVIHQPSYETQTNGSAPPRRARAPSKRSTSTVNRYLEQQQRPSTASASSASALANSASGASPASEGSVGAVATVRRRASSSAGLDAESSRPSGGSLAARKSRPAPFLQAVADALPIAAPSPAPARRKRNVFAPGGEGRKKRRRTMLRSRSNRQQRPSESTDERQGSGSGYGGYPAQASSPMVSIASGADDDVGSLGGYGGTPRHPKPKSRFGFGGGGGGGGASGSATKKFHRSASGQRHDPWDRRRMGDTVKGPKGGGTSAAGIFVAVLLVLTAAMGVATMHYKKATVRLDRELAAARRQARRPGGRHRFALQDDDVAEEEEKDAPPRNAPPEEPDADPRELADLRSSRDELRGESTKWRSRSNALSNEIDALRAQAESWATGDATTHAQQLEALKQEIEKAEEKGKRFKGEFVATHRSGNAGIVPGGPGHALVQRKEIERMESLEDYEEYVQRREDSLWEKIDILVDKMAGEAAREASEWFGPGPHRVELEIEYPQYTEDKEPKDWPRVRGVFTMEMAPLDLMPVAVNLFLQQIHHKLWNGCSFVINAVHILQAGPHRYTSEGKYDANIDELAGRFKGAKLDKMPYQEYHAKYPHSAFTVGFAGRPGGPDFYINKMDNKANHGPGGQTHHDLHEEADPCFARLVGGMSIIDDLNKVPVNHDQGSLILQPVVIVDSRVIATREKKEEKQAETQRDEESSNNSNAASEGSEDQNGNQKDDQNNNQGGSSSITLPAMGPSPGT